jgi:aquaporin Z
MMYVGLGKKLAAEFVGTFWLVFGGAGAALFSAEFPHVGIGLFGIAVAFGLTVTTTLYAIGPISGGHINPVVSIGLACAGRFSWRLVVPYAVIQFLGGIAAGFVLYLLYTGRAEAGPVGDFAANGYGEHSPGHFTMLSAFISEALLTGFLMLVILGSTEKRIAAGFAPLAIGLVVVLAHLISLPIDGTSLNPALSVATALVAKGWALEQLWLFLVAPTVGAVVVGWLYPKFFADVEVPALQS